MSDASAELSVIGMIPARGGSKRVPRKNIRMLQGHPLLAYSIAAARESGVFSSIIVSTDDEETASIARDYGAEVPFMRPSDMASDTSPDIEWVEHALTTLARDNREYDCFSILRPTNPFRQAVTISRAWQAFRDAESVHSLRAVELCSQHPGKMWVIRGDRMLPLLPLSPEETPWHSQQYRSLPEVYVQNASLEIAWTKIVKEQRTIAGSVILPFFTTETEGLDVNTEFDWKYTEYLLECGLASLPRIA